MTEVDNGAGDTALARLDLAGVAQPLDGDDPVGPDLEYDADFMALSAALATQGASMIEGGEDDGGGPDWRELFDQAVVLAERSRDLRIDARLTRCALHHHGMSGLAAGLALFRAHLADLWLPIHPAPDREENYDITARYNAVMALDDVALSRAIGHVALLGPKGPGALTLAAFEIVSGKRQAENDDVASRASEIVAAAGQHADTDAARRLFADLDAAIADAAEIETLWSDGLEALGREAEGTGAQFGGAGYVQLERLRAVLADVRRHLAIALPVEDAAADAAAQGEGSGTTGVSQPGQINSRADAAAAIGRLISWFETNEPSSPVPAMLTRARSMINKSFLQIVEELGDQGIAEARKAQERERPDDGFAD